MKGTTCHWIRDAFNLGLDMLLPLEGIIGELVLVHSVWIQNCVIFLAASELHYTSRQYQFLVTSERKLLLL